MIPEPPVEELKEPSVAAQSEKQLSQKSKANKAMAIKERLEAKMREKLMGMGLPAK